MVSTRRAYSELPAERRLLHAGAQVLEDPEHRDGEHADDGGEHRDGAGGHGDLAGVEGVAHDAVWTRQHHVPHLDEDREVAAQVGDAPERGELARQREPDAAQQQDLGADAGIGEGGGRPGGEVDRERQQGHAEGAADRDQHLAQRARLVLEVGAEGDQKGAQQVEGHHQRGPHEMVEQREDQDRGGRALAPLARVGELPQQLGA